MMRIDSEEIWYEAWLDTPLSRPTTDDASMLGELRKIPGCCLKSFEREANGRGLPKDHGRLVRYDAAADRVIVAAHNTPLDPKCVWIGTVAQYEAMFEVD